MDAAEPLAFLWARSEPVLQATLTRQEKDELGQYTNKLGTLTNAVSFGILVLTMIGAAGMMISMLTKEYTAGKGSTVRSRMVLFLVFGDFWLGLIGMIPTLATLAHHPPHEGSKFCNAMGYLLATSIYVQHLNTLALCVSTFFILVHPLSLPTRILEKHWRWLFPLPWLVSLVLCGIAWGTQGDWGYNNGVCFYKAGLFSEIWQFVPRFIVFSVISILYVRLFVFLRRPDKIRSSTSLQGGGDSSTMGGASQTPTSGRRWSPWRFGNRNSLGFRSSVPGEHPGRWAGFSTKALQGRGSDGSNQMRSRTERGPSAGGPKDMSATLKSAPATMAETTHFGLESAASASTASAHRDLPAWERLELPDYSKTLVSDYSPPLSPKTQPAESGSGWKWGMGASKSFGGVEPEGEADEPVPSKQPRRSTLGPLAPLKIPHPAPPAQPALRRNSSFVSATPGSRRPSVQESEKSGDGRLLDFPFASLRRGSHVSFAEHPTPTTPSNARSHTPPPSASQPPSMPQTFGGPEPGQSISSVTGGFAFPGSSQQPFPAYSFASQGSVAQAPLLSAQVELNELSPQATERARFSDASATSGIDPKAPTPSQLLHDPPPPIVLSQDFAGSGSSVDDSAVTTSETRRNSAATASEKDAMMRKKLLAAQDDGGATPAADGADGDESDGEEYSLARILELSAPPDDFTYYTDLGGRGVSIAARGQGSSGEIGSGTGSGSDGNNQESMSKFMNRKASLLMLTFPLAYVLLFTVSLIRIIYDFATPTPIPVLAAISRWLVFSQGLVDAFIYGIIEWRVKRTVRRRTRKLQSASGDESRGGVTNQAGSLGGRQSYATTAGIHRSSRAPTASLP